MPKPWFPSVKKRTLDASSRSVKGGVRFFFSLFTFLRCSNCFPFLRVERVFSCDYAGSSAVLSSSRRKQREKGSSAFLPCCGKCDTANLIFSARIHGVADDKQISGPPCEISLTPFQFGALFSTCVILMILNYYRTHFRESATNGYLDIFDLRTDMLSNINIRLQLRKVIFSYFVVKKDLFGRIGGVLIFYSFI